MPVGPPCRLDIYIYFFLRSFLQPKQIASRSVLERPARDFSGRLDVEPAGRLLAGHAWLASRLDDKGGPAKREAGARGGGGVDRLSMVRYVLLVAAAALFLLAARVRLVMFCSFLLAVVAVVLAWAPACFFF